MTVWNAPLVLASSSPRRAELLAEAGFDAITCPPIIDDGVFVCGEMEVHRWVETLAVMKALHVQSICTQPSGTILAADTVCVVDGKIYGQPASAIEAKKMIVQMTNREHEVCTGWCLISMEGNRLRSGCNVSIVSIDSIAMCDIEKYIESGSWQGKAGGYNLSERLAANWPIVCHGDMTSVMGLPMDTLITELDWNS
jgi:septum formation protein